MADDSWVECYRLQHESSETWAKKRHFLLAYCNRFEEDRLLCLAQAYVNIVELGCSYPKTLMDEVGSLAADIGEPLKYRGKTIAFVRAEDGSTSESSQQMSEAKQRTLRQPLTVTIKSVYGEKTFVTGRSTVQGSLGKRAIHEDFSPGYSATDAMAAQGLSAVKQEQDDMRFFPKKIKCEKNDLMFSPEILKEAREIKPHPPQKLGLKSQSNNGYPKKLMKEVGTLSSDLSESLPNEPPAWRNRDPNEQQTWMNCELPNLRRVAKVLAIMSTQDQFACERIEVACSKLRILHKVVYSKVDRLPKNPLWRADVYLDGVRLASSDAEKNKNTAKHKAYQAAELRLRALPPEATVAAALDGKGKVIVEPPKPVEVEAKVESSDDTGKTHVSEKIQIPGLIIVLEPECLDGSSNYVSTLHNSVTACRLKMNCDHVLLVEKRSCNEPLHRCRLIIENKVVSEATGPSKPGAKEVACKLALDTLRKTHPVIKVHDASSTPSVFLSDMKGSGQSDQLGANNIGMKMLQNMGWTGGGIGKKGREGIEEPITVNDIYQGHMGLGHAGSSTKSLAKGVNKLLAKYMDSHEENELVFSSELSKEERELVHKTAQKLGLKSQSRNKDGNRYLIVKRKQHPSEILHHLLANGGRYGRYELVAQASEESEAVNSEDELEPLSDDDVGQPAFGYVL
ncbi:PREDICTED: uncharacterized protein LOC106811458 isoform X2 [Priapulus caudatus]|nr:PREDICTED: uncharacterized protein LOC106811458 isoform X2 [Priapulus caudatus]XP_014670564.1 PREDICTED: uncharacterized protein LOC106811458 isoform X2 [Priapulus caudatus]